MSNRARGGFIYPRSGLALSRTCVELKTTSYLLWLFLRFMIGLKIQRHFHVQSEVNVKPRD